jgi:hypothetical protein
MKMARFSQKRQQCVLCTDDEASPKQVHTDCYILSAYSILAITKAVPLTNLPIHFQQDLASSPLDMCVNESVSDTDLIIGFLKFCFVLFCSVPTIKQ